MIKKIFIASACFLLLVSIKIIFPKPLDSANMTVVKDTLETSRLSFDAQNSGVQTSGSSVIKINASGPSITTANLFPNDTIKYVSTGASYVVDQIIDGDEFSITSTLGTGDTGDTSRLVVNRTAYHTVTFTTVSAISNGSFIVKIKAGASNSNDTYPDQDGFDFNSMNVGGTGPTTNITCPGDVSGFQFGTGDQKTATASGGALCTAGYHCFECRYAGTGASGTALSLTVGGTTEALNPGPASGHTEGTADTYAFVVENLDANRTVVDSTTGRLAVVESVRVTATVDPRIDFALTAVSIGTTYCGVPAKAASTATAVPFGSLNLAAFNNMHQQLSAVTNALGGYVVTAVEDDQSSIEGDHVTEIADSDCDGGGDTCNESTTAGDWVTDNTTSGFGFSIEDNDASKVAFEYDATDCSGANFTADVNCSACAGAYCAMKFPAASEAETPLTLFKNTSTPTATEDIYVCYRMSVSTVQPAGDYENNITYRATATF